MLLMAYLAFTNDEKKHGKMTETPGSSESTQQDLYPMNTSLVGFQKSLHPYTLDESSLTIRKVKKAPFCLRLALSL